VIERRSWAVGVLFVLFILFCGFTHLLAILHVRGRFDFCLCLLFRAWWLVGVDVLCIAW
jgi:hypothetical protein